MSKALQITARLFLSDYLSVNKIVINFINNQKQCISDDCGGSYISQVMCTCQNSCISHKDNIGCTEQKYYRCKLFKTFKGTAEKIRHKNGAAISGVTAGEGI